MEANATDLLVIVMFVLAQPGFGAVVAMVVNLGKLAGVVKDGTSGKWSTGLNLLGVGAVYVLALINPSFDLVTADGVLGQVAQIGGLVLALVLQLYSSRATHEQVLRNTIPVVGKSFNSLKPGEKLGPGGVTSP